MLKRIKAKVFCFLLVGALMLGSFPGVVVASGTGEPELFRFEIDSTQVLHFINFRHFISATNEDTMQTIWPRGGISHTYAAEGTIIHLRVLEMELVITSRGFNFDGWTVTPSNSGPLNRRQSTGVYSFDFPRVLNYEFIMPAHDVTIFANYMEIDQSEMPDLFRVDVSANPSSHIIFADVRFLHHLLSGSTPNLLRNTYVPEGTMIQLEVFEIDNTFCSFGVQLGQGRHFDGWCVNLGSGTQPTRAADPTGGPPGRRYYEFIMPAYDVSIIANFIPHPSTTTTHQLTATPTSITFPEATAPYNNANMWQTVTITNTGTAPVNNINATFAIGSMIQVPNFEFETPIVAESLAPGASITTRVRPRSSLPPHFYAEVLEIRANELDDALRIPLNFSVLGTTVDGLTLTPPSVVLSAYEDYAAADLSRVFTLANNSGYSVTNLYASLDSNYFDITINPFTISGSLATDNNSNITVTPISDLEARDEPYEAVLTITGQVDGAEVTRIARISLQVEELYVSDVVYEAEVTPASITFSSRVEGYAVTDISPSAVVIRNTGTGTITNLSALISEYFEIVSAPTDTSIEPGDEVSISVRPIGGLLAENSPFTGSLLITGDTDISFTIPVNFAVTPPPANEVTTYIAGINPSNAIFPVREEGYSNANLAREFVVSNIGTGTLTNLSAQLVGDSFEISQALSQTSIEPGGTATISVRPVSGLLAENSPFIGSLAITGDNNIALNVTLSFAVTEDGEILWGDLNKDNFINNLDLVLMMRYFSIPGTVIPNRPAADVDANGRLDGNDLVLFLRFFAVPNIVLGPTR